MYRNCHGHRPCLNCTLVQPSCTSGCNLEPTSHPVCHQVQQVQHKLPLPCLVHHLKGRHVHKQGETGPAVLRAHSRCPPLLHILTGCQTATRRCSLRAAVAAAVACCCCCDSTHGLLLLLLLPCQLLLQLACELQALVVRVVAHEPAGIPGHPALETSIPQLLHKLLFCTEEKHTAHTKTHQSDHLHRSMYCEPATPENRSEPKLVFSKPLPGDAASLSAHTPPHN